MVKDEGQELFGNYRKLLDDFYAKAGKLAHIHVLTKADLSECESYAFDDGKILMFPDPDYLNGKQLYDMFLSEYRLQMEMVTDKYVVAMTSIMDTPEGFDRLIHALYDIDQKLEQKKNRKSAAKLESRSIYTENKKVMQMRDAEDAPQQEIPLEESVGKVSAGFVFLYPPGIPVIVPGEEINGKFVKDMKQCMQLGLDVEGLSSDGRITIVN